ncbi:MAG: hypothetical protein KDK78_04760, partial [Chlamydiia bacterium]|nr:hypothetical protein [Chlamydiia bacterium]
MVESIPHTRGGQPKQPLPSPIQHQLNRINSDLQALGIQPAPLPDLRSSESLATYIITTQSKLNEETRDRGGKVGVVAAASIQEATSAAYKGKPDQLRQTLDQTEFVACQLNMQSKLSEPVCYLLGKLEISTLSANTTLDDALVLLKHCGLKHEDIPALMTEGQAGQLDALRLASLRLEHHRICLENCVQLFDLSGSSDGYQFAQQLLSMCGDRQRNPSEEVTRLSHAKSNRDFYIESVKDRLGEPLRIKDAQGHIREEFEPRIIISAEVNSPAPSGGFKVCRRVVNYSKITGGASLASKDPQNDPIDVHEALLQDTLYRVGIPNIPQVYSYAEDHITMEQCGETVFEFIQSNPEYGHRCDLIDIAFVTKEMLRTLNAMHNATITSVALWQLYPSG